MDSIFYYLISINTTHKEMSVRSPKKKKLNAFASIWHEESYLPDVLYF